MNQITQVLKLYDDGKYSTKDFCDIFEKLYFFRSSGQRLYGGEQRIALDKLALAVERYSSNAEDLKKYPMYYSTEDQIRSVFESIKGLFFDTEAG